MIAFVLGILLSLLGMGSIQADSEVTSIVIPPMPSSAPTVHEDIEAEWSEFHAIAAAEYADEFTALFNSYEFKVAKNGRGMIRTGNSGPFKFVKKG